MAKGWVYFLRDERWNLVKIGWTGSHPSRRYGEIQSSCAGLLDKLGVVRGPKSLEADLHRRFAGYRRHGEWFEYEGPIVAYVLRRCREWPADRTPVKRIGERPAFPEPVSPEVMAKQRWWEEQGHAGDAPVDRIILGVNGYLVLRPGDTAADYWRHINTATDMAIAAAIFSVLDEPAERFEPVQS